MPLSVPHCPPGAGATTRQSIAGKTTDRLADRLLKSAKAPLERRHSWSSEASEPRRFADEMEDGTAAAHLVPLARLARVVAAGGGGCAIHGPRNVPQALAMCCARAVGVLEIHRRPRGDCELVAMAVFARRARTHLLSTCWPELVAVTFRHLALAAPATGCARYVALGFLRLRAPGLGGGALPTLIITAAASRGPVPPGPLRAPPLAGVVAAAHGGGMAGALRARAPAGGLRRHGAGGARARTTHVGAAPLMRPRPGLAWSRCLPRVWCVARCGAMGLGPSVGANPPSTNTHCEWNGGSRLSLLGATRGRQSAVPSCVVAIGDPPWPRDKPSYPGAARLIAQRVPPNRRANLRPDHSSV